MDTNLHTYDRHVKYEYLFEYEGTNDQLDMIKKLSNKINDGKDMFDLLINSIGTVDNIDNINNYSIDRLLYDLANIIEDNLIVIFEEQLIDMRTGACQQGRSLRLIQVIQSCLTNQQSQDT